MRPWRRAQALIDAHPELLGDVLRQVHEHGPLTVTDLDAPNHRDEPWWGYGPGKVALEVLFAEGVDSPDVVPQQQEGEAEILEVTADWVVHLRVR